MSSEPNSDTARFISDLQNDGSLTSPALCMAVPPAFLISDSVRDEFFSVAEFTNTAQPFDASSSAMALPSPLPAAVTTPTFPFSSPFDVFRFTPLYFWPQAWVSLCRYQGQALARANRCLP